MSGIPNLPLKDATSTILEGRVRHGFSKNATLILPSMMSATVAWMVMGVGRGGVS